MKRASVIVCFMLIFAFDCYAARLVISVPQNISEIQLLSGGTPAVLDHLKDRLSAEVSDLENHYEVNELASQIKQISALLKEREMAYAQKVSSIRNDYISKLSFTIHSIDAEISPESSSIGDIMFYYTVTNRSDRIITDIMFKPKMGSIILPTTTTLILEFINPDNLKLGIAPGESISNTGHDPERFSFFIGDLSKEELQRIRSDLKEEFSVQIVDLHFAFQQGYKGQRMVMGVDGAFAEQLKPFLAAIGKTKEDLVATTNRHTLAVEAYEKDKGKALDAFTHAAEKLKQSSLRYSCPVESTKNRCTFEGIDAGTYVIYASPAKGRAVFQEIRVDEGKHHVTIDSLGEDPFLP